MGRKKEFIMADKILVEQFGQDAASFYGDDFSLLLKAVKLSTRTAAIPSVSHTSVQKHATELYRRCFAPKVQSDEKLAESVQEKLLKKSQLPAVQALLAFIEAKKREGKTVRDFSAAEKKVINDAYNALGDAAISQAVFAHAIHYLTKHTIKKPSR